MKTKAKFNLKDSEEICIIDDSPMPRFLTQTICEKSFPAIPLRIFENVETALVYLDVNTPKKRTIFLDLDMPGKNGWDFLSTYSPKEGDTIYILSSSNCNNDIQKMERFPMVTEFLMKPLTPEKLQELTTETTFVKSENAAASFSG